MNIVQQWLKNCAVFALENEHLSRPNSSGNKGSVIPFLMEKHRFLAKVYGTPQRT